MSGQCPIYGDLAHKFIDLTVIDTLVQFFNEVLDQQEELHKSPVGGVTTNADANSVLSGRIRQPWEENPVD